MSTSSPPPTLSPPRRGPRIWLRLLILLALIIASPVLFYVIDRLRAEWELRAAWAEADRTDPGWRFEDLQAKREVIPDEENGALQVLKALRLLPKAGYTPQWKTIVPGTEWSRDEVSRWRADFMQALDDQPANTTLNVQQILGLDGEVEEWNAALDELRRLVSFSRGRYPQSGTEGNTWGLLHLLNWQVRIQAHRQNWPEAVAACRAAFALQRCIGDEPSVGAPRTRVGLAYNATDYVERLLGQGEPPAEALAALQRDVRNEMQLPHFLRYARAERAEFHRLFRQIAAADSSPDEMKAAINYARILMNPGKADAWLSRPEEKNWLAKFRERIGMDIDWKRWETEAMQASNAWVAIAKLPTVEQYAAYKAKRAQSGKDGKSVFSVTYKLADSSLRVHAKVLATETALALERCRQELGRWPDKLDDLAPRYIDKVPIDPFTGRPLCYRRLADGVAVYSVGMDEQDNGGKSRYLPNDIPGGELQTGLDIGIRLWDPDKRRAPPLPPLPPPKRERPDDF